MLAAAARLFTERGFESATIAGIAEAADVSPETIYATFRNKRTLLAELVSSAVRGGDDAPVLEQAGPRAVAAARDQREQLRLFAADIALRLERVGPLLEVLTTAARSDPELAELRAKIHGSRLEPRGVRRRAPGQWPAPAWSATPRSTTCGRSQARSCINC